MHIEAIIGQIHHRTPPGYAMQLVFLAFPLDSCSLCPPVYPELVDALIPDLFDCIHRVLARQSNNRAIDSGRKVGDCGNAPFLGPIRQIDNKNPLSGRMRYILIFRFQLVLGLIKIRDRGIMSCRIGLRNPPGRTGNDLMANKRVGSWRQ